MTNSTIAKRAKRVRRARGSISAQEILGAAMRIARDAGVDVLSMPKLAEELRIGITSIYWYFGSKEELVQALTLEAARQLETRMHTSSRDNWLTHLREMFAGFRAALREDDLLCDLLFLRSGRLSSETLVHLWPELEVSLQLMVDAGFTPDEAIHNYFALSHFTRGAVVLERQMRKAGVSVSQPTPVPERFPRLAHASKRYNLRGVTDTSFDKSLQSILDGMQARLDVRAPASKRVARRSSTSNKRK